MATPSNEHRTEMGPCEQRGSGDNETTNEVSLPCIESERILNALDELLVKLRTVLRLPLVWAQLVDECGHHVAEPLAHAAAVYLQLRQQFHEDAERLRASVPPPSSSHSLETFDVTDTAAAEPTETAVPLAPSNGLLGTPGADPRCVAALADTIEQLAAASRRLVRQWRHHAASAGLDGPLAGPASPPAQQFLRQMAFLRRQMYLRLVTTPDQEASRTERLREIWRRDNHNRQLLDMLQTRLDGLLQQRDDDRRIKNAVIDKLEGNIAGVERKSTEDVANVIAEAEGDITAARAAYQMERERLKVIYEKNMAGLQELRVSNRKAEAALKKRKYKIESELENWLQKYDAEMMEKTEEIEGLQAEFEKETAEREEYDAKVEAIRDRYDSIILKRERREEQRIFEEQLAIKKAAAALYIQAFWRGYRVRKRLKKGKKGKGKKGKKGGGKKGGKSPKGKTGKKK
ncbi:dynein regulatory complex protein 10-like [Amphibalanus amphitrite]|uniref:dynein regulatory complex protein 10-like n=1 Tax=Amphibalanus amphitrite TaxID=1232801 RepID=UPI001C906CD8|nr:dynein regulatory complex protein 10-like [Amphibalanus amphitrite]